MRQVQLITAFVNLSLCEYTNNLPVMWINVETILGID
jgi:hypothetical protein